MSISLDLTPPEGKGREALLQIVCRDGRVISLCADSADDALSDDLHLFLFLAIITKQINYENCLVKLKKKIIYNFINYV